jgi:hypothetical protein
MWTMIQHSMANDFVIALGISHSLEKLLRLPLTRLWRAHGDHDPSLKRPNEIGVSTGDAAMTGTGVWLAPQSGICRDPCPNGTLRAARAAAVS